MFKKLFKPILFLVILSILLQPHAEAAQLRVAAQNAYAPCRYNGKPITCKHIFDILERLENGTLEEFDSVSELK